MLQQMINIPSPSGYERELNEFIKKEADILIKESKLHAYTEIDKYNNLIVVVTGKTTDKVIFDAHSDQIGFMTTNINDKGKISVQYIGGGCKSTLSVRELSIVTKNGIVPAIVNRKHSHLIRDEKDEIIKYPYQAEIDIGCNNKKETEKYIEIGDPIVYKPSYFELRDNKICGTALDDKTGCYVIFNILKNLLESNKQPTNTLIFTFTCGEETGVTRLKNLIRRFNPKKIFEFDVMFATDYMGDMENRIGKVELGKGSVLFKGDSVINKLANPILQLAKKEKIPTQVNACGARAGYNSDGILEMGYDTDIINIGIPLRNMHSPTEVCSWKDLNNTIDLITKVIKNEKI